MPCEACGAAVTTVESTPRKRSGQFKEEYECANKHKGWITGKEDQPPKEWKRYGQVFDG